ncbi:tungstate ABC transporter substrate-binding protein WtpA [Williamwhitmania taraxaci]|nr:tungstate ABC transporter substrate-binding protein WtpA [Williamwhitmania taraxaci]
MIKRIGSIMLGALLLWGCAGKKANEEQHLTIFHAGSLSMPLKAIADSFMRENPGVVIDMEAAGSIDCVRKVTELNKPCDVLASADFSIIDSLMMPAFTAWNIRFAGNEMAIVFHEKSRLADKINSDNWFEILANKEVALGRSNPSSDPCGYRTVMMLQLAEKFYGKPNLAANMLGKDKRYIRPKETDLLALLESNAIDYIFLYRSVAIQHGLKFIELPDAINLGNPEMAVQYAEAKVTIAGKQPGDSLQVVGSPMVYGITIPKNAENPALAEKFVEFLLSPEKGGKVLASMGQPSVVPSAATGFDFIPSDLQQFAKK